MSGALTQDQIEEFNRRKLENKIKNGQFIQIANIPRVISKLTAETEQLQQQLSKTSKKDTYLEASIRNKLSKNEWLLKELNNHRETGSEERIFKTEPDLADLCANIPT